MNFWKICLKLSGWKTEITVPYRDKAIICVVPHTSNWDFIIGLIAYRAIGRKACFLMKEFWFFFPLNYILKSLGGIPVRRDTRNSMTLTIADDFKSCTRLNLAITPEGTRKPVDQWKTGFLRIAYNANVIIQLGLIDYLEKKVVITTEYEPTGYIETDLLNIKTYYSQFGKVARHPQNFKSI